MADHPVKRTLERDVLPYIVSARQLRRQWFYRMHTVFGYTTDIVIALATIGIAPPLLRLLGATASAADAADKPPTLTSVLASLPPALVYPAAILIVVWIVIRVAFAREEGQKRAVLARSCTKVLEQAEAGLPQALGKADPMPALTEMLEKRIRPTVDRNIQESSWPWLPFAPKIEADVEKEVKAFCLKYGTDWTPVSDSGLREPPVTGVKP
jgi:hypothetical protein